MRVDLYLYKWGHTKSRQKAQDLIAEKAVTIDGTLVAKPSLDIDETVKHTVEIVETCPYVGRGGLKLEGAIQSFGLSVKGLTAMDIGASTGGFTDCLLQRGAKLVYAVDSGHSQLDPTIESNEKVVSIEKYNAKFMTNDDFECKFDIAVMDVSFISQTLIHSGIQSVSVDNGIFISLIKPQFECGKSALNSHGIVKKSTHHMQAIVRVIDSALINGFTCVDIVRSPIEGGSGNVEFLACFVKDCSPENKITEQKIKQIIQ
jgi:23S rRNA (cytidine1920-2'-O)/16S rRNA (cytidine1409-2'-O)-methyltransferase